MSDEQFSKLANTFGFAPSRALREMLDAVTKQEREACAALAQETACDTHLPTGVKMYGTRVAKVIRARSNT